MTEPPRQPGFGHGRQPDLSAVTIRPLRERDRPFLRELAMQLAPGRDQAAADALNQQLAAEEPATLLDVSWFIATGAKKLPLGVLALRSERVPLRSGQRAAVTLLAVAAGIDAERVGSAMLTFAEDWAKEHGYDEIGLEHFASNPRAGVFYDALGYAVDTVKRVKRLE